MQILDTVGSLVILPILGLVILELIKLLVPLIGIRSKATFGSTGGSNNNAVTQSVLKYLKHNAYYVSYTSFYKGDLQPSGIVIGLWFAAWIVPTEDNDYKNSRNIFITLWATKSTMQTIKKSFPKSVEDECDSEHDEGEKSTLKNSIKAVIYDGTWRGCGSYISQPLLLSKRTDEEMSKKQDKTVQIIIEHYKERMELNDWSNGNCIVLISGPPNTGKSTIPKLIAQKMNAYMCSSFKLTEPGMSFNALIDHMRTESDDEDKPFIILINEIDRDIENIHNSKVQISQKLITPVTNKTSFNDFLDEAATIPRLMLIFTTNWTIEQFDNLDKSYVRDGRITLKQFI
jgi:hypothetical protein